MPLHPRDNESLRRLANLGRTQVPAVPDPTEPPSAPRHLEVFGVGIDHVQLTWSALGPGPVRFRAGDAEVTVEADGGPGGVELGDLLRAGATPGGTVDVDVHGAGVPIGTVCSARLLPPPPGEHLHRLATLNDVHIGQRTTGYFHTIMEIPQPDVLHPVRCAEAALAEAARVGADRILVKGDLTHASTPENWSQVAALFDDVAVPFDVVPGNHEGSSRSTVRAAEGLARHGHHLVRGVETIDVPGLRIVLADSTIEGSDWGRTATIADDVIDAAAGADGGVLVAMHHQPMRLDVPTYLPPGITRSDWSPFAERLLRATPDVVVTTGHTHRHRRYRRDGVPVTEVGSTKDFPGTWAVYDVFEGGIVQSVRRITRPDCIRWTDHTRRAAAGVWQWWSPGSLDDRCAAFVWTA